MRFADTNFPKKVFFQQPPFHIRSGRHLPLSYIIRKALRIFSIEPLYNLGDYLSSHMVSHKVFSAVWSLTTVFGMGTGISFIQSSPKTFLYKLSTNNIVYPLDIHSFINIINMTSTPYAYINHITSFIHSTYTLYINLSIIVHSKPYNELLY